MNIKEINSNEIKYNDLLADTLFKFACPDSFHNITDSLCLKTSSGYVELASSRSIDNSSCKPIPLKKILEQDIIIYDLIEFKVKRR